ncbi:MAG: argininosuccinate lyase [Planctomycetota bacterium]
MAMWGGRFAEEAAPLFQRFNDSLPFDCALIEQDVAGSKAWAEAIRDAGVLTPSECDELLGALDAVVAEAFADPGVPASAGDEDVHGYVERKLVERVGVLGKKLHTGRSRNDQVATDFRLWCIREARARIEEIRAAQLALVAGAERQGEAVMPGFTHLQAAQPVLFGHWCLAYVEMLERDAGRFTDALVRLDECPLGSGALAGTAYPVDRGAIAASLGFSRETANSLDAVADRDFVLELLHASATCAVHLSRLAEDLIVYASEPFGMVSMSDQVTTGSSLMPQKKNPDALELIRGKAGRLVSLPVGLAVTLKGLPLAYNKDMQEDKEGLFESMDQLSMCLRVMELVIEGLKLDEPRARALATRGYTNATDLADYLVEKGVAFRDAHEIVGRIVNRAVERGVPLEAMPLGDMRAIEPVIEADVFTWLDVDAVVARRDAMGGTSPRRVKAAIEAARARLESRGAASVSAAG